MNKINYLALAILAVMFLLMLGSVRGDSAIIDELAHIPAGFGYLQGDYRLNPEHPPLVKTLAAISGRIFVNPNFPTDTKSWSEDINGQWDQGAIFLYESGNDADRLIFWMRLPLLLLAVLFGWIFFRWMQKRFGSQAAIIALIFFVFSPTLLTHSRYVTTDLGAAFGFFIGIISFIKFLEAPSWRNVFWAGLLLGTALLLKFSLVLLLPLYGMMLLFWIMARPRLHLHERFREAGKLLLKTLAIGVTAVFLIWGVYALHTFNYPHERQISDSEFILTSYPYQSIADFNLFLIRNPVTRSLGHYLFGVLMVNQRSISGNTQFFLGEISASGFPSYFPILYLLKEPLAFHILTAIALWFGLTKISKRSKLSLEQNRISLLRAWVANHFTEFSALLFIAFYWILSVTSPLNIGIRHVLPTFPFIYLLVSRQLSEWLVSHDLTNPSSWLSWLKNTYELYVKSVPRYLLVSLLFLWLVASVTASYPNFMTYYNELAGGERNGFNIAVDSNYDWGQDLKRLKEYTEKNEIPKIFVDYFGGGQVKYYFGNKGENWWSSRGTPPAGSWFAVSATIRQGAFGEPVAGFQRKPEDSYLWLRPLEPVARIGSIFVYKLP